MNAKEAAKLANEVSGARKIDATASTMRVILDQIRRDASSGFNVTFYRETVPAYCVAEVIKELKSLGYGASKVDISDAPNHFKVLVTW